MMIGGVGGAGGEDDCYDDDGWGEDGWGGVRSNWDVGDPSLDPWLVFCSRNKKACGVVVSTGARNLLACVYDQSACCFVIV